MWILLLISASFYIERQVFRMKTSGIGGQAVIEGVMMKNKEQYAIAVRKPNHEIEVELGIHKNLSEKYSFFALPIIRGVVNFIDSMVLGMKTLTFSASFYEEEEEEKSSKMEQAVGKVFKERAESVVMGLTVTVAIIMAVAVFMILPMFLADFLGSKVQSDAARAGIEGGLRLAIFVGYLLIISQMKDIKRVFMYHGAEHKAINCIEHGKELTIKNVKEQSRYHKRCGTSFMLIVMVISIFFFIFIRVDTIWLRIVVRILLIPVIAGVSYEFIRLAGRSESPIVNVLSRPGMWLQGLTTREPEDDMIEVAIQSVDAVFDWKEFIKKYNREKKYSSKNTKKFYSEEESNLIDITKIDKSAIYKKNKRNSIENKVIDLTSIRPPVKTEEELEEEQLKRELEEEQEKELLSESTTILKPLEEEEDDLILKALDYYFDSGERKNDEK